MNSTSHYEAVLADLEQMKADAEAGIRAITKLMSRVAPSRDTEPAGESNEKKSIPTKILEFLAESPAKAFRAEEIEEAIKTGNIKSLRGALARMVKEDGAKIKRAGRGRYKAKAVADLPTAP